MPKILSPDDPFLLDAELSDRAIALRDRIRAFGSQIVLPVINDAWEDAEMPSIIEKGLGDLGIVGTYIEDYGCPGLSREEAGIVARELGRIDGSVNTFFGVHSNLAMGAVYQLGNEEQRTRWLPQMATMERTGAFALTEPQHGSDSVSLETSARRDGDGWRLKGQKRWIGNGHRADLVVVFARNIEDQNVKAFVMETTRDGEPVEGFSSKVISGKIAKRAINQAHLYFEDVYIPDDNRLPHCDSFSDVNRLLGTTRGGASWEALGHGLAAFDMARQYVMDRDQFGAPLASYQLIQERLSTMLSNLVSMQLLCRRMSELQEMGKLDGAMASLVKMTTSRNALAICRDARDMMGGNGLLLGNDVARHLTDMEVVSTYEGTDSIQALILGRAITGYSAFSSKERL